MVAKMADKTSDRATTLIRDVATFGYLHSINSIISQMRFCGVDLYIPQNLQAALCKVQEEINRYSNERITDSAIIDELKGELGKTIFKEQP